MFFDDGFSMYEIKHKKDDMPKSNAKISSRPFILATTSVWIGCIQKRKAHRNGILNTRSFKDLKGLKLNNLYIKMKIKLHNKPYKTVLIKWLIDGFCPNKSHSIANVIKDKGL